MEHYDHTTTEAKWQKKWEEQELYKTANNVSGKENYYCLVEYPYPSGNLHLGHWYAFAVPDIFARYKRMKGFNVMYPFGFDSFGLPAENAAIQRGLDPKQWTYDNIDYMTTQVKSMGTMFDWSRKVITSDPDYYKWTQWLFLEFYKNGLAFKKSASVNWCPKDQTVLANEQVIAGECERCGTKVEQKELEQWFFKITEYADRLLTDLEPLNWPEEIKQSQRNWIGKSEGAILEFKIQSAKFKTTTQNSKLAVDVFTTRPDTLFGATYVVLAPEHKRVEELKDSIENWDEVAAYIETARNTKEIERTAEGREKTGVELKGVKAINPGSKEEVPIFIADYVLAHYGTGAIMAVPAHDQRDFEFAQTFNIPVRQVIMPVFTDPIYAPRDDKEDIEREMASAIVFNKKKEVLVLDWIGEEWDKKKTKPRTLLTGGIDDGEDAIEAAKREVTEETGYTNLKHVKTLPQSRYQGFAAHKDINRIANTTPIVFELIDETKQEVDPQELEQHVPIFISVEEAKKTLIHEVDHYRLDQALRDPIADARPGVLINSNVESPASTKKTVMILHGTGGNSGENWYPWLAGKLRGLGYEVIVPDLPNSELPNLHDWLKALEPYKEKINEDSIIIGHSLGAGLAEHFVQQNNLKVDQLVLIAPLHEEMDRSAMDQFEFFQGPVGDALLKFTETPVDRESLKDYASEIIAVFSDNDPYIPLSTKDLFPIHVKTLIFEGYAHFGESHGFVELPELLDIIQIEEARAHGEFNGMDNEEAKALITDYVGGEMKATFKLRDWLLSRQRYWGCPIPIVYDPKGNAHPVPEEHLPWILPEDVDFKLTGKSPLETSKELVERTEKTFGKGWRPEVDTMDTFVDSSWYFQRYTDPNNEQEFAGKDALKQWMPIDRYSGGAEHTTMHVLYSRFFHKAMFDLGLVHEPEPYIERINRGIILGPDGNKMSKSKGNVIDPGDQVEKVGADTVKMYLAFIGPFNETGHYPYDLGGVAGIRRFLEKVWKLQEKVTSDQLPVTSDDTERLLHQTIKKVGEDCESFKFNTAISQLMILTNQLDKLTEIPRETYEILLRLLAPFAPHMMEEIWEARGPAPSESNSDGTGTAGSGRHSASIHLEEWPGYEEEKCAASLITWVVQVNGKVRAEFEAEPDLDKDTAQNKALSLPEIGKWLDSKEPKRVICVPGKLVNIVV